MKMKNYGHHSVRATWTSPSPCSIYGLFHIKCLLPISPTFCTLLYQILILMQKYLKTTIRTIFLTSVCIFTMTTNLNKGRINRSPYFPYQTLLIAELSYIVGVCGHGGGVLAW